MLQEMIGKCLAEREGDEIEREFCLDLIPGDPDLWTARMGGNGNTHIGETGGEIEASATTAVGAVTKLLGIIRSKNADGTWRKRPNAAWRFE